MCACVLCCQLERSFSMLDSFDVAVAMILVNGSPGNFKSKVKELIKRVMGKSYYSTYIPI